jgi:hypothetical protein
MEADTIVPTEKSAVISECGRYRYWLERKWSYKPMMIFSMLNPSTADGTLDDPTIRRCVGFARREYCGGIIVVNLFAGRATDPDDLFRMDDPVGPDNDKAWRNAFSQGDPQIVCAWGAEKRATKQAKKFLEAANAMGRHPLCLGTSKEGAPRHPLYLPNIAALISYG